MSSIDTEFRQLLAARLGVLGKMGLAEPNENGWIIRRDFLQILMSDPRMPTVFTRAQDIESLEGRVLAHVHDDLTGAPQMILEGTDAKVHFIRHTEAMEQMRTMGQLKPNNFVSFERAENKFKIEDQGDARSYLSSDRLRQTSKRLIQRGILPVETECGGWLGDFYRVLTNAASPVAPDRTAPPGREKERGKGHGR
jgi:hypothetical protein